MISSSICACGRPSDSFGGLCDRCVALQTLGLVNTSSDDQIENAYHTLVQVWHPDRFQSDPRLKQAADEKLKEINAAHDYLTSTPPAPPPAATVRRSNPSAPEEGPSEPPERTSTRFVHDSEAGQPEEEVQRILRRYQDRKSALPRNLVTAGFTLGTVAVLALVWFLADGILSSNQSTALAWTRKKTELSLELHAAGTRLWSNATDSLKDTKQETPAQTPEPAQSNPVAAPPPADSPEHKGPQERTKASGQVASLPRHPVGAQPYITAGLSPAEVLSVLGNPTSSSGEKMFYKGSEIDFQNGQVVGWKIDPRSAPLRVKLWPDTAPVPGLTTFGVGSSKSDVIAIQGTPTLFSRNEFGYGGSVIFFQNDHVVGWKEDPASTRLKVAR